MKRFKRFRSTVAQLIVACKILMTFALRELGSQSQIMPTCFSAEVVVAML